MLHVQLPCLAKNNLHGEIGTRQIKNFYTRKKKRKSKAFFAMIGLGDSYSRLLIVSQVK